MMGVVRRDKSLNGPSNRVNGRKVRGKEVCMVEERRLDKHVAYHNFGEDGGVEPIPKGD